MHLGLLISLVCFSGDFICLLDAFGLTSAEHPAPRPFGVIFLSTQASPRFVTSIGADSFEFSLTLRPRDDGFRKPHHAGFARLHPCYLPNKPTFAPFPPCLGDLGDHGPEVRSLSQAAAVDRLGGFHRPRTCRFGKWRGGFGEKISGGGISLNFFRC